MILKKKLIFSLILTIAIGCGRDPLKVDITDAKVDIGFTHLDSILYNAPSNELIQIRKTLSEQIAEIFDYQIGYCMQIGKVDDTAFVNSLLQYRNDAFIQELEKEIAKEFSNLTSEKEQLILAFRHLKAHFPKVKIPSQIVFQNSLFNSSAFCTEKEIGIGLEQYLGEKSPSVQKLPSEFYDWIKKGFDRTYLVRDAILSWVLTHVVSDVKGNLAEEIINYGKAIYITEATMPNAAKHVIIRYSEADLKWAKDNEYSFWKYLVDEKMLFKTDDRNIQNMLSEGPFTAGLPEKGPDRLGQYLGWQIVKNYMESTEVTFEELLSISYNEILQTYEPD